MDERLEALIHDQVDGRLDEDGRRRLEELLEGDPEALAAYVDQLQVHQRLQADLAPGGADLPGAVVRELRLEGDGPRFAEGVVRRLKERPRSRLWEAAAAALVLGVLAFVLLGRDRATPAGAPGGVLLVVGRVPLDPGDVAVRARLERLAGPVTLRAALEVVPADARGRSLVAVSSTAYAPQVAAALRDLPVPVVTWEPRLYADLGLAGAVHQTDWAVARGQAHVVVAATGHPLAAGLSGRVEVASAPGPISWGRAAPGAVAVAVLDGDPSRAAILATERPVRRAGFFLFDDAATTLTEAGWTLFDAAVRWCLADRR
jgi:hypothetical protein